MKRIILAMIFVFMLIFSLTACGCKHEWCEATCTVPRTCKLCELTEGESKGHSLVEANYQKGKHCVDCSEIFGEPVEAEFERTGRSYQTIDLTAAHGNTYEYTTGKNKDTQAITGKVKVNWAIPMDPSADPEADAINCYVPSGIQPEVISIIGLDSCLTNLEGYQWKSMTADVTFSEQRYNIIWGYEDYYNLAQYDKNAIRNDFVSGNTNGQTTTATFSVEIDGQTYDQCMMFSISWVAKNKKELNIMTFYRVPAGYDGCVFSLIDSRVLNNIEYTSEETENGFTSYEAIGHGAGDVYFRLK